MPATAEILHLPSPTAEQKDVAAIAAALRAARGEREHTGRRRELDQPPPFPRNGGGARSVVSQPGAVAKKAVDVAVRRGTARHLEADGNPSRPATAR